MPALVVKGGPSAGQRVELGQETELGRTSSQFLQEDAEISRRHAVVRRTGAGFEIEDLGSSNGTFVNEERISGVRRLSHGDRVRIGQTILEVEAPVAAAPAPPGPVAPEPVPPAAPQPPSTPQAAPPPPSAPPEVPVASGGPPAAPPTPPPVAPQPPQPPQAPVGPQGPFQPPTADQPTAPQPPAPYGQPGAYGQPAGYARTYGAPAGARTGLVTAAAIFLFVAAVLALIYSGIALVNRGAAVIRFLDFLPFLTILFYGILVPAVIMAILQIVGGILVLGLRGRGLALTAAVIALVIWVVEFVLLVTEEGAVLFDFAMIGALVGVNVGIVAMLASAGRHFSARRAY